MSDAQFGVIGRKQLLAIGLSSSGINGRIESGRLHRVYDGSYSMIREIDRNAVWWAAHLSAGSDSAISHMSAAHLWGISNYSGPTEATRTSSGSRGLSVPAKIITPGAGVARLRDYRRLPVLKVHRTRNIHESEITLHRGIPVTTVARLFVDIAGRLGEGQLKRLLHEASRDGMLKFGEFRDSMVRARGKQGIATLRQIIDDWDPQTARTRNDFEEIVRSLCSRGFLPPPVPNAIVAGYEVDFLWPEFGLIVEADGARDHDSPMGWERDGDRDAFLQLRGFTILRLTWPMVTREAPESIRKIREHQELCRRQGRRADPGWATASLGNF